MPSNREIFEGLIRNGSLAVSDNGFFATAPPPLPRVDPDRVAGMLLGVAIGDSLGNSSEGVSPRQRRARFGEIREYQYNRYLNANVGTPTDDTQLTFWAIEEMLRAGGFDPEAVSTAFTREHIFGIGSTMRAFVTVAKRNGGAWHTWGRKSAGNGALMRIAPALLPHLRRQSADLWVDAALLSAITHNDSASIASCVAFTGMLWELLGMKEPPLRTWWTTRFVELAKEVESGDSYRARHGHYSGRTGFLWQLVEEMIGEAKDLDAPDACEMWGSGAYLLETVPSVLAILERHADDPEEAIVRAVNDTWDNDTVAAIIGAAVGALHGRSALPEHWIDGLLGRTRESDDGAVFRLVDEALDAFVGEGSS